MDIRKIPVPEVYKESQDFRFFVEWFADALEKTKYDTEHFIDLYDPLRCPKELLWALGETMGYKYDSRLPASFNRLVLLYFMSMIKNKGSKDGVTLAAETNLVQFNLLRKAIGYEDEEGNEVEGKEILFNRLEETDIPTNSVYVSYDTGHAFITVVYFATQRPVDACIEYVRPLGMYLFQYAGVKFGANTKIAVDARLTDERERAESIGVTHVGHYSREDYTRQQKTLEENGYKNDEEHKRRNVWYRNSDYEGVESENPLTPPDNDINPGYRALYSLQLCNNENIVDSLLDPIFSIGYGPQDVETYYTDDYYYPLYEDRYSNGKTVTGKAWNLRYDKEYDEGVSKNAWVNDGGTMYTPEPAVNPVCAKVGDAISLSTYNDLYSTDNSGRYGVGNFKYFVKYKFISADGSEMPFGIYDLCPVDEEKYMVGTEVAAKEPEATTYYDSETGKTWSWQGWDKAKETVVDSDVLFIGMWKIG